jgi:hypothetical protein
MIRKVLLGLLALLIGLFLIVYLVIPGEVIVEKTVLVPTAETNAFKFLTDKAQWTKWWPGEKPSTGNQFVYKQCTYTIQSIKNSGIFLTIKNSNVEMPANLVFAAGSREQVRITIAGSARTGVNPIERAGNYFKSQAVGDNVQEVLDHLKKFLANDNNVYQLDLKLTKVQDSIVLATKIVTSTYPVTATVYNLVNKLRLHIKQQNGIETAPPMLNVNQIAANRFEVMVGIPLKNMIKTGNNIFINKMVLGNIIEAQVKGGTSSIIAGENRLKTYVKDYELISPAMPFESMVTNRDKEPDTAKWITRLYYPIF